MRWLVPAPTYQFAAQAMPERSVLLTGLVSGDGWSQIGSQARAFPVVRDAPSVCRRCWVQADGHQTAQTYGTAMMAVGVCCAVGM
jgi:hypothetical protein